MPIKLAEGHLLVGAGLADDTRRDDGSCDKGAAAHHRIGSEDRDQPVGRVDAILQRDDRRLRADNWADLFSGGLDVPQLDAEEDVINVADAADIVSGLGRPDMGLAAIALDLETVLANCCEMGAARNEDHIRPGPGERGAIGPTDAAGADHGDAHPFLLSFRSGQSSATRFRDSRLTLRG